MKKTENIAYIQHFTKAPEAARVRGEGLKLEHNKSVQAAIYLSAG